MEKKTEERESEIVTVGEIFCYLNRI